MYGLIGKSKAKPARRGALIASVLDDDTTIPGCLSFVVARDPGDPDIVWITEVRDSQGRHRASLELPSVKASIECAMPLIAATLRHSRESGNPLALALQTPEQNGFPLSRE